MRRTLTWMATLVLATLTLLWVVFATGTELAVKAEGPDPALPGEGANNADSDVGFGTRFGEPARPFLPGEKQELLRLMRASEAMGDPPAPVTRDPVILGNLATFREWASLGETTIAGVLTPTWRADVLDWPSRPDGIEWANLLTKQDGAVWEVKEGARTDGATDSDAECDDEVGTMCADAGHGGASGGGTRTQHAQEDGGGCSCVGDCDEHGAVAFVTSSDPCG